MSSLPQFPHLEFSRDSISKRAKETSNIIKGLRLLTEHSDKEHRLYINDKTGELWQYSNAWNWGAKPYCFIVPEIDPDDWLRERYVDPDELLIYGASMRDYLAVPSNRALPNLGEHMRMLQQIKTLPKDPEGRWFGPYLRENVIPPPLRA